MLNRFDSRLLRCGAVAAGLLAVGITGCELIATVDRSLIQDAVGGSGGLGGSGGGTGGSTGGAGGSTCVPEQCEGVDEDCRVRACDENDECVFENVALGSTCTGTGDETVCDGDGNCVECNVTADCDGDDICAQNLCVPAGCVDGELGGDETDIDCGGSCPPCVNGDDCNNAADCQSGVCDPGGGAGGSGGSGGGGTAGVCAPCTLDGDCQTDHYCDSSEECQAQGANGTNCTADNHCLNDHCPSQDQICCDTACDAICEACLQAKNGGSDGTCAPVSAGPDPDGDCSQSNTTCTTGNCTGTAGACEAVATTVECRGSQGACDPAESCDGQNPGCPTDAKSTAECQPSQGVCDPAESCDGQNNACPTDAKSTQECNASVGPCDAAEICDGQNDTCPGDVFIAAGQPSNQGVCAQYLCDGTQAACPTACTTAAECVSPATCPAGLCCLPAGETCVIDDDCCNNCLGNKLCN